MLPNMEGLREVLLDTRDLRIEAARSKGQTLKHTLDEPHKAGLSE